MRGLALTSTLGLTGHVPGIYVSANTAYVQPYIRGIGSDLLTNGAESSVAIYVDGIYRPRPVGALQEFLDTRRVEVLKGPQGTLYGRNAVGGTIHVLTNEPELDNYLEVELGTGNFDRRRAGAVLNAASRSDSWRLRFAAQATDRAGFTKNLADGSELEDEDSWTARAKTLINVHEDLVLSLGADYSKDTGSRNLGIKVTPPLEESLAYVLGGTVPASPREILTSFPTYSDVAAWGLDATVSWGVGGVELKSILSARRSDFTARFDIDSTELDVISNAPTERTRTITEELQLSGGSDRFSWVSGIYLLRQETKQSLDIHVPVLPLRDRSQSKVVTESAAIYADASIRLANDWRVYAGLRYSVDQRDFDLTQSINGLSAADIVNDGRWSSVTPRIVLEWNPRSGEPATGDWLIYGSLSRGYKAGGFNTVVPQVEPFSPEHLLSYEIGVRKSLYQGRANVHVAAYYYDYRDVQLQVLPPGSLIPFAPVQNAGDANASGLEVSWYFRLRDYTLAAHAAWQRSKLKDVLSIDVNNPSMTPDLTGNSLPRAPEISLALRANKEWSLRSAGQLDTGVSYSYVGKTFFSIFEDPFVREDSYGIWGVNVSWRDSGDRLRLSLSAQNLGNHLYATNVARAAGQFGVFKVFGPPRTYNLDVAYRFD